MTIKMEVLLIENVRIYVMLKILITAVIVAILTGVTVVAVQNSRSNENDSSSQAESDTNSDAVKPIVTNGQTLDLSGQGLTKAPAYIFDKTEIEELNLSDNNLEGALQAEVRHLQNLKVLNLSNNQFTGVPAEVGQLKNLEVLDLSNNQLTGLPHELGNLSNLKVLNLRGNNYLDADLSIIKEKLPDSTVIQVD